MILLGFEGVLCQMYDVLVFGASQEEHDNRLENVLRKLSKTGITLNSEKCEFSKDQITFVGHLIDKNGIQPDPTKVPAVKIYEAPQNVTKVRLFMGMVNQLGRFTANLAEHSKPLRDLLHKDNEFTWGHPPEQAFIKIKDELSNKTELALYDPKATTKVSADASSYGPGAVLLQVTDDSTDYWKPTAYASRSMSQTEQ